MNRILMIWLLAASVILAGPLPLKAEVTGDAEFSHDSNAADLYAAAAGYRHPIGGSRSGSWIGFKAGLLILSDPLGRERFNTLELGYRSRPFEGAGLDLKTKKLWGDWSPWLYSGNLHYRPDDRWYLEVFGERSIVDTVTSVRLEYLIDTYGLSADYKINQEFTLVGALFTQDITDGNNRFGKVGRVIYVPRGQDHMNFQLKMRMIDSDFNGTGYFSPEKLTEYYFLFQAARPFADDNWVFKALLGPGIQMIDGHNGTDDTKPAFLAEGRIKGWFTQEFGMEGRLGYTTAQSTGGGERYIYGEMNLVHTW
ncbi:MAG: hypothetical protein JSV70_02115 [bacterium]|nr:MAG: hypothetical protein JSV70_02115 [bacterium]